MKIISNMCSIFKRFSKKIGGVILIIQGLLLSLISLASASGFNLPEPVSPATRKIFDLHTLTSIVATIIMIIVIVLVTYVLIVNRKSQGAKADMNFHTNKFGTWGWMVVPIVVLGIDLTIAGPGTTTLHLIETSEEPDLTVKVTGQQWRWAYEYMDHEFGFISSLESDDPESEDYLIEVDNPLVLPVNKRVRFLHTASDVVHAWWVPALAYKKDSIPGYILETWTVIEKEGTYRGQCAEICGTRHAYMPIVVNAVSEDEFDEWVSEKQEEKAIADAEAASMRDWTMDELLVKGEEVYVDYCSACHGDDGEGVDEYPALIKSAIANGAVADHMNIVINGKKDTAMAAWGEILNDLEIAAVITFERNRLGNQVGDIVQPKQVREAR